MKKVYLVIGIIAAFSIFIFGTKIVLAGDPSFGLDATAGAAKLDTYGKDVPTIAGNIIGTLLSMISVLFFVLVLYGGILWMTARGSSETTEKALNTIIAATIGIIIIIGAYALTNFVFKLGSSNAGTTPGNTAAGGTCQDASSQAIKDACATNNSITDLAVRKSTCNLMSACMYRETGNTCITVGADLCPKGTTQALCTGGGSTDCTWVPN